MELLKDDRMLKFRPDTLECVRKEMNLDSNGRMAEAIDILEKWVQMQPHFVKKDFSRDYLERSLISAKGQVERAKNRLDKLCTFKTLMPQYFAVSDMRKEFTPLKNIISTANLPKLTPQNYRVYISKIVSESDLDSSILLTFYKYLTTLSEYFKQAEYCSGFIIVLDYSDTNLVNLVTKINPLEFRQIVTLMTEGYGMRLKSIHVITASKAMGTLISLLKQVFSSKLMGRIHTHKNVEGIHEFVPKHILPVDYGGEEKSLKDLNSEWLEAICSEEFLAYVNIMNQARTNESCRQADKFNENYIGMPGSFRALSVD